MYYVSDASDVRDVSRGRNDFMTHRTPFKYHDIMRAGKYSLRSLSYFVQQYIWMQLCQVELLEDFLQLFCPAHRTTADRYSFLPERNTERTGKAASSGYEKCNSMTRPNR